MLAKLNEDNEEDLLENDEIKSSNTFVQLIKAYLRIGFFFTFKKVKTFVIYLPIALLITIFQKLRLFALILFSYLYLKYNIIITTNLL